MTCRMYQKWISDDIDGALGEVKKRKLELHLESCAHCRAERVEYQKLQGEVKRILTPVISPDYWREFPARLEKNIRLMPAGNQAAKGAPFKWNWAWIGAGMTAVIALVLVIMFSRQRLAREHYFFSLEDSLQSIYERIGDNEELEGTFDSLLQNAIKEVGGTSASSLFHFFDEAFFWESLSEEDISILEKSIKNEIKS